MVRKILSPTDTGARALRCGQTRSRATRQRPGRADETVLFRPNVERIAISARPPRAFCFAIETGTGGLLARGPHGAES